MRTLSTLCLLALLIGCRAPASQLPAFEVLRFGVGHMGGSVSFVVKGDGTAEYREEGGPNGSVALTGKVSPEELRKLAALLEANDFCSLVSTRSTGVPDEARPSASVRLHGLDCEVQMWDGEFRDDPEAKASLAAIEAVGASIRKQGD